MCRAIYVYIEPTVSHVIQNQTNKFSDGFVFGYLTHKNRLDSTRYNGSGKRENKITHTYSHWLFECFCITAILASYIFRRLENSNLMVFCFVSNLPNKYGKHLSSCTGPIVSRSDNHCVFVCVCLRFTNAMSPRFILHLHNKTFEPK